MMVRRSNSVNLGCPILPHLVLTLVGQPPHNLNDDRPESLRFLPLGGRDLSIFGWGLIKYPTLWYLEYLDHE